MFFIVQTTTTDNSNFIIRYIARLLGWLIEFFYNSMAGMGIENVALSIILLTVFVRLLLFPFNLQQTRSTKIQQFLKPEFEKISKKYRGKKDQDSMMKQQTETRALQKEYNIKMSTGCLTMIIQFPIIIALYRVIMNVGAGKEFLSDVPENAYKLFAGITLNDVPKDLWRENFWVLLVPVLSFVFQLLSMIVTPNQDNGGGDPQVEAQAKAMKRSMYIMPIFSLFICISLPVAVGLYWTTSSALSVLVMVGSNFYFDHIANMEKVVEKAHNKGLKKIEKDKAKGKKSFLDRLNDAAYGQQSPESESADANMQKYRQMNLRSEGDKPSSSNGNVTYKKGSLADKANALSRYNDSKGDK